MILGMLFIYMMNEKISKCGEDSMLFQLWPAVLIHHIRSPFAPLPHVLPGGATHCTRVRPATWHELHVPPHSSFVLGQNYIHSIRIISRTSKSAIRRKMGPEKLSRATRERTEDHGCSFYRISVASTSLSANENSAALLRRLFYLSRSTRNR